MFLGPMNEKYKDLPEISPREVITLAPLGIIVVILGIYPMPVLDMISTSMENLIEIIKEAGTLI